MYPILNHQLYLQIKLLKIEREEALKNRDRLSVMKNEKDAFLAKLKEARMSVYKVNLQVLVRQFHHLVIVYPK